MPLQQNLNIQRRLFRLNSVLEFKKFKVAAAHA